MQIQAQEDVSKRLMEMLCLSQTPLSTKELGRRLHLEHLHAADYEVSSVLRVMSQEGLIEYKKGRWSMPLPKDTERAPFHPSVTLPKLSPETIALLNLKTSPVADGDCKSPDQPLDDNPDSDTAVSPGRWDMFRRLLSYYRQCVKNEEGADASAFQNEHGKRFIYIHRSGQWFPRPGLKWSITLPIGPHFAPLLNLLPDGGDNQSLVIGYPVQAHYVQKEDEPGVAIIRPVFFFLVDHAISGGGLQIFCEEAKPEINLGWLEYAFLRKPEQQRNFLSACGFINRWRPNDEIPALEKSEVAPALENLVAALVAFMPQKVKEPLELYNVSSELLQEPFDSGIYNRAVLMLAKRTRFTATLLTELAAIEKMPDEFLDATALRNIFAPDEDSSEVKIYRQSR